MGIFSIATFFIKRPVFTTVCTLLILLVGAVCIPLLPISYLPPLTPVTVQVSAQFIGADAQTVENTVCTVLERQINGATNMLYLTSASNDNGQCSITVYFAPGTNQSLAQVDVQNRVGIAQPQLPDQVKQVGVTVQKTSPSILLVYGFFSPDGQYDTRFVSNYVDLYVQDEIQRLPGVALVTVNGQRLYAMRLWLDPQALAGRGLTSTDVVNRLKEQNTLIGLGAIGQAPTADGQTFQFTIPSQTQLKDTRQFENLILKVQPNGDLVRLRDVGRVEFGAQDYTTSARTNGKPSVALLIFQTADANALDVANAVKTKINQLKQSMPPGLTAEPVFDTTLFVNASTEEVFVTLIEAILLVVLVIFIFLQDWRALIIPVVAIPVSLVGALAFAYLFGFSLNTLTMFGLILATGLVVDDAIVVIEGIVAKIEQGLTPREAALEAMEELSGAVIAMSLVLMAVFIPVAFFPGTTGLIYQQFALTIVFSIAVSAFNALTFSPSVAAILLRPRREEGGGPLGWFFRLFNRGFAWFTERYTALVRLLIRVRYVVMAVFAAGLLGTVLLFQTVPGGFVPEEDQGVFLGVIQAPPGSSLAYTDKVGQQIWQKLQQYEELRYLTVFAGYASTGNAPNIGFFYGSLKPWEERKEASQSVNGLLSRINKDLAGITDARVVALNLPAIIGLGTYSGLEFQLQDQSGGKLTVDQFVESANEIIAKANASPVLAGRVFTPFPPSSPQVQIDIDRDRLEALNVNFQDAMTTLGTYIGSNYVNQFVYGPRYYRVYVQADLPFRDSPKDLEQIYVRSQDNQMVPLSNLIKVSTGKGPQLVNHFNVYRAIDIVSSPAPGYSSGQAIAEMQRVFAEAAVPGLNYSWFGTAREEVAAGGLAVVIFGFGLVIVFLVLSAQYESYVDPLIIMLTVPLALLGALSFVFARGLINDVYCQIALVMLIGLAAKNAILIVEFANQQLLKGKSIVEAAVESARERLRPILMTALAALAGFWPLVVAAGAGANSRVSLGTTVFGGLLVATFLSLLLVPVLYVVIKSLEERFFKGKPPEPPAAPPIPAEAARQVAAEE
ncbi:MAG: efflux RND transporter permease subunit [Aphanocapsa lilacina HA4352-LM1]|jgi:HAE1 family hydrophobic/amphiphilic exporter-1|nr:efflux RND transporter permease subunit [Aphanocapsa lilacina HA4352-LM1]